MKCESTVSSEDFDRGRIVVQRTSVDPWSCARTQALLDAEVANSTLIAVDHRSLSGGCLTNAVLPLKLALKGRTRDQLSYSVGRPASVALGARVNMTAQEVCRTGQAYRFLADTQTGSARILCGERR